MRKAGYKEIDVRLMQNARNAIARALDEGGASDDLLDEMFADRCCRGIRHISDTLDQHPETIRKAIKKNGFPAKKFNGRWKCFPPAVVVWVRQHITSVDENPIRQTARAEKAEVKSGVPIP